MTFDLDNDDIDNELKILDGREQGIDITCNLNGEDIVKRLQELKNKIGNREIYSVTVKYNGDYIYEESELKKLQEISKFCNSINVPMEISLSNIRSILKYDKFIIARNKIEDFVKEVNSITINDNGKQVPLSPIEKYFVVYNFVANRIYNESPDFGDDSMRNWVGVLSGDYVICSGFSSLLKCVCDRVFNKDELACYTQGSVVYDKNTGDRLGRHANNLIILNDKKYNIKGLFTSDSCWGSPQNGNIVSYEYCLNPITVYSRHNNYNFEFEDNLFFYKHIGGVELSPGGGRSQEVICNCADVIELPDILLESKNEIINKKYREEEMLYRQKCNSVDKICEEELSEFVKNNGLEDVFDTIVHPYNLVESVFEKYPELNYYQKIFNDITVEDLQENIDTFKNFAKYYHSNKTNIFNLLEKCVAEKFPKSEFFKNLLKGMPLYNIILNQCQSNERAKINEPSEEDIEENINKEVDQAIALAFAKNKDFFIPPNIPNEAIKNGLAAVAKYSGITNNANISKYVYLEMERMQLLKEINFMRE